MQLTVTSLDGSDVGSIELDEAVFGVPLKSDILHQVVRWQLSKRRAGTHKTKTRGEVRGSTRKIYKQKGTGRARHGSPRVAQFRGGGRAFGPVPRDHGFDLPKKVRKLGLKMALSGRAAEGKLIVVDAARLEEAKTKVLAGHLAARGISSALIIDGPELDRNFTLASRNIVGIDVLSGSGANVYDILRRDLLILTQDGVRHLQEHLA